jgi:phosphinothricin acetyltransferase
MTQVRKATLDDAGAIARIYAPYVTDTAISFETEPVSAEQVAQRMQEADGLYPWFVATEENAVVGYAYAAQFRIRPAYRFAVETSIYLEQGAQGRGVGTALYRALLDQLTKQGFTQAIAGITLPNEASVRVHERVGFALVGIYKDIGYKLGRWRDVGRYQCPLAESKEPAEEPRNL